MAEYIDRENYCENLCHSHNEHCDKESCPIWAAPAADVVPIEALKKWLWKVALNNSDNYLGDACEELVSRLDGLRRYVKDGEE